MKTMKCNQLGGSCEREFRAETFEEIKELSKSHGMEMFRKGDTAHLEAMQQMKEKMQNPGDFERWMELKRQEFEALPES